jgi:hypothetical protein
LPSYYKVRVGFLCDVVVTRKNSPCGLDTCSKTGSRSEKDKNASLLADP